MFGVSFGFGYFYLITVLMAENAAAVAALFGSIFTQEGAAMGSMNIAIIPQILFGGLFGAFFVEYIHAQNLNMPF